ncbi:MAG: hypothetical protein LBF65_01325 [Holosporales bacterium]|jgi:hypothetical protein|nr:hypothetical protein [Holosporales bacterium]
MSYFAKAIAIITITTSLYHQASAGYFVDHQVTVQDLNRPGCSPYAVKLHDGDMLNFASPSIVGKLIRFGSMFNSVANPDGISHSGIVIISTLFNIRGILTEVYQSLDFSQDCGPQINAIESMRACLGQCESIGDTELIPFCFESDIVNEDVERSQVAGAYVRIVPLDMIIAQYEGNIYVRQLHNPVQHAAAIQFVRENITKSYEGLSSIGEFIKSPMNLNRSENISRLFCSELAALFYRQTMGLNIPNVSNIIPEEFGSKAGIHDLLSGYAGADILLKERFVYHDKLSCILL